MLNPNSKNWGYIQWMDEQVRKWNEQQERQKPQPSKSNWAVGSMEWQHEVEKRRAERAAASAQTS